MEREIGFHLLKKSEYQGPYWNGSQRFSMGCATSKPNASYEDDNWGWFQELLMKSN